MMSSVAMASGDADSQATMRSASVETTGSAKGHKLRSTTNSSIQARTRAIARSLVISDTALTKVAISTEFPKESTQDQEHSDINQIA